MNQVHDLSNSLKAVREQNERLTNEKNKLKNYVYLIPPELEANIKNLYNESLGNCVENKIYNVIILFMKQIDWFYEADKIFSTKKEFNNYIS